VTALLFLCGLLVHGQKGVTTFGIQFKPVLPLEFFDPLTTTERPSLKGSIELTGGSGFGMSVRVGLTNAISLETGLGQIKRSYTFGIVNDTSGYSGTDRVRFIGYELPITGLVFIRLGERMWMNTALGFVVDMYPGDAQQDLEEGRIYIFRRNWVQMGVLGNLGVEYRTEKSGSFYLGATYHRPFNDMALAELTYYGPSFFPYTMQAPLDGSYLTVDLRYYFHEDPETRRKRTKKGK
jgi:hypothetical protein